MPAVKLSPIFNGWQGFTPGGLPMSGGFIYTYAAGTSTPLASYTTTSGSVANSNPIPLGADGRPPAEIWLAVGSAYKFILTDASLVPIGTYDDILGVSDINNLTATGNTVLGTTGNTLNVSNGAISVAAGNTTLGGNLSVVGNTTLTGNITVNGNTTVGNASSDTLTIAPSAITYSSPTTHSNDHTFSGALTVAGATALNGNIALGDTIADILTFNGLLTGNILPGAYTPTCTAVANCTSPSATLAQYVRIGGRCLVMGSMGLSVTSGASVATQVGMSLPIASAMNLVTDASGGANRSAPTTGVSAVVYADTVNDRVELFFTSTATGVQSFFYWYLYEIK